MFSCCISGAGLTSSERSSGLQSIPCLKYYGAFKRENSGNLANGFMSGFAKHKLSFFFCLFSPGSFMLKIGRCLFTRRVYVCLWNASVHFLLGNGSGKHPQHATCGAGGSLHFRNMFIKKYISKELLATPMCMDLTVDISAMIPFCIFSCVRCRIWRIWIV